MVALPVVAAAAVGPAAVVVAVGSTGATLEARQRTDMIESRGARMAVCCFVEHSVPFDKAAETQFFSSFKELYKK